VYIYYNNINNNNDNKNDNIIIITINNNNIIIHYKIQKNKAIADNTLPALCTPVTPFPADPIFRERGSAGMIPCAA